MRRILLLSVVGSALAGALPETLCASARCVCDRRSDAEWAASADEVFVGRVRAMRDTTLAPLQGMPGVPRRIYVLEVRRRWKGPTDGIVQVIAPVTGSSCGFRLWRSEEYVVFASRTEGLAWLSGCSPLRRAGEAGSMMRMLDSLFAPPST